MTLLHPTAPAAILNSSGDGSQRVVTDTRPNAPRSKERRASNSLDSLPPKAADELFKRSFPEFTRGASVANKKRICYDLTVMARRPDSSTKKEEIWTRTDLKEIMRNLSLLSEHGVREFYERAYRECRIINSHTFPPARAVQELVQAWKQLRQWRRP